MKRLVLGLLVVVLLLAACESGPTSVHGLFQIDPQDFDLFTVTRANYESWTTETIYAEMEKGKLELDKPQDLTKDGGIIGIVTPKEKTDDLLLGGNDPALYFSVTPKETFGLGFFETPAELEECKADPSVLPEDIKWVGPVKIGGKDFYGVTYLYDENEKLKTTDLYCTDGDKSYTFSLYGTHEHEKNKALLDTISFEVQK
ncbi:hypothetical protein [Guggenheimella bovis]